MRQLTPAQIAADIKAARAIAAQTIASITHPVVPATLPPPPVKFLTCSSPFAIAIDASHRKHDPAYLGHAGEGGLQTHSIGGLYPYLPVGYGHGKWAVHNLVSGERTAAVFDDYSEAAEWAERFKLNPAEMAEFAALSLRSNIFDAF